MLIGGGLEKRVTQSIIFTPHRTSLSLARSLSLSVVRFSPYQLIIFFYRHSRCLFCAVMNFHFCVYMPENFLAFRWVINSEREREIRGIFLPHFHLERCKIIFFPISCQRGREFFASESCKISLPANIIE